MKRQIHPPLSKRPADFGGDVMARSVFLPLAALALVCGANSASADTCIGNVSQVALNPMADGIAWANVSGVGMKAFCNINTGKSGYYGPGIGTATISPAACVALYSSLLTAQQTGRSVTLYFEDSISCASNGTANSWFAVFPSFVVMN